MAGSSKRLGVKTKSKILFTLSVLSVLLYAEQTEKEYQIITSNNGTLTGGPNDLGPTGDLEFIYINKKDEYKYIIHWELYINGDPNDFTTTRTNPNNNRIDRLYLTYLKGKNIKYGLGVELLGNLGGSRVQNFIHRVARDSYIPAQYSSSLRATPTINLEYNETLSEYNVDIQHSFKFPLIVNNGIIELSTNFFYDYYNLDDYSIDSQIGFGVECNIYPNIVAFSGYPLRDFMTCTPATTLNLTYEDIIIYLKVPLLNSNVQNSIIAVGYRF